MSDPRDEDLIGRPIERTEANNVFESGDDAAEPVKLPDGFRMREDGLHYEDDKGDRRIAGRFHISSRTSDFEGENAGICIEWLGDDGTHHSDTIFYRELRNPAQAFRRLADKQLFIAHGADKHLARALNDAQVTVRSRRVNRIGWHVDRVFVLPGHTIGGENERVAIDESIGSHTGFGSASSLDDWKIGPATLARNNNVLMFAIAVALSGPAIGPVSGESLAFHLVGASSIGKTTAARLAASVWGRPSTDGFMCTWRTTANALELLSRSRCDTCLVLDEIGMASSKEVAEAAYLIASGTGKERMTADGRKAPTSKWRVSVLSTGEVSLDASLRSAGRTPTGGQSVRFISIPADAGSGMGAFESLNGTNSPADLSRRIQQETERAFGTAGPEFARNLSWYADRGAHRLNTLRSAFVESECAEGFDAQVRRVGLQFGLIAAAGALAAEKQIVPWTPDEAVDAARFCFRAWLQHRGHAGSHEIASATKILRHELLSRETSLGRWLPSTNQNRFGYRRIEPSHLAGIYIFNHVIDQLLDLTDAKSVLEELKHKGHLRTDPGRHTVQARDPVTRRNTRFYCFTDAFLEDAEDATPDGQTATPSLVTA